MNPIDNNDDEEVVKVKTREIKDIVGQRFGKWTVIGSKRVAKKFNWIVKCDCGTVGIRSNFVMVNLQSSRCFRCYRRERRRYVQNTCNSSTNAIVDNKS